MNKVTKIIIFTFGSLVLGYVLIWVGYAVYSGWTGYQWEKKTEEFQMMLSKPYREDVYGGKTPEETWALFLDALRKGDVELASKYIVPEKRESQVIFFNKEKEIDGLKLLLDQYSSSLQKDEANSSGEVVYFMYSIKNNDSEASYSNSLVFILNPYTKVWKISVL